MDNQQPAVIVTGSTGLLGLKLADAGYQVYGGFDRVGLPEPPKHHEFVCDIEWEMTNSVAVRSATQKVHQLTGGKLASVVHMAAYYNFSVEDSDLQQ